MLRYKIPLVLYLGRMGLKILGGMLVEVAYILDIRRGGWCLVEPPLHRIGYLTSRFQIRITPPPIAQDFELWVSKK